MKRGRGGRPSKGPRDAITVRPHADLGALIRDAADDAGMPLNDYCALILAQHMKRPDLAPPQEKSRDQEVLPLAATA